MYIRITHLRRIGYIKTSWVVDKNGISRTGSVRDAFVLEACSRTITGYISKLNGIDTSSWGIDDLKRFLSSDRKEYSFSSFARSFIDRLEKEGSANNARIYMASLRSIEKYFGTDNIAFTDFSVRSITAWIAQLKDTKRARSLYPRCLRVIYGKAISLSHEPASNLPVMDYDPWRNIRIPDSIPADKRAIEVEDCRDFFAFEVGTGHGYNREIVGRDVALLSFCLAGMNTVDLFKLRKSDIRDGVICYNRSKTESRRKDRAYFEMRINPMAAALIEKYRAGDESELLLSFGLQYKNARSFNAVVNKGIRLICERMGCERAYSFYSFRHTWATVAMNCCGASLSDVGFALNHTGGSSVTRGYIKFDFNCAWELNEKVVAHVFGQGEENDGQVESHDGGFDICPRMLIRAAAFFKGRCLAHFEDIGYSTIDEVTRALVGKFPPEIPPRSIVQFKIVNCDNGKVTVYEHMKGKGF